MASRSLQDHLDSGDGLARLAAHAQRLLHFQRLLEAALPEALRPHVRVANFRLGKLFIHTASGAVAAKVRQFGPRLASELSSEAAQVTQIEVRVQARSLTPRPPPHIRPALPGTPQKQRLTSLASTLPTGSRLKASLERLLQAVKE